MKQLVMPRSLSFYRLRDPDKIERTTVLVAAVLGNLSSRIERLNDEKLAQPARRHTVAIDWVETGELILEIEIKKSAAQKSSYAKRGSGSQRTSSPSRAASSLARACIRWNRPCD